VQSIYRVTIKKVTHMTFVNISAMRADFCMKFYKQLNDNTVYTFYHQVLFKNI